ncbi:hypothetical protein P7K49_024821 [Saguinus oedipus]|uniref:Uncharacterized protein n=1 Tax=Saguinus oedipus TaxID=9490 RepID=A0ABQ9URC7_SAGOE|nr:hypothetical protein P7K49_024821 [Saguinus oedipus]
MQVDWLPGSHRVPSLAANGVHWQVFCAALLEVPGHGLGGIQEGGRVRPGCLRSVGAGPLGTDRQRVRRYVQHYGLGSACDNIERMLKSVAVKLGKTQKLKILTGTGE